MIARRTVTAAVAQLLAQATGKPVGQITVPINPSTGKAYPPPYTLLYPLDHTTDDRTLADAHQTAVTVYQATCVSGPDPAKPDSRGTAEQAEWLADKARTAMLARPADGSPGYANALNLPGVSCYRREADIEAGATSDATDAIITYVIRFRLYLEAAA
ncbi:hypothetical protein [Streptomyces sp. Ac-502]|uniref:hypothetical protein n=1 Tax=Streptomyces sp. Ac-502 TaxID=3342801 RepID=UPI003862B2C1